MKKTFLFSFLLSIFVAAALQAQPQLVNQRCIGSSLNESFNDVIKSNDNNFWVTMVVNDSTPEFSDKPFTWAALLMKMDTNLNIITKKYFGGSNGQSTFNSLSHCKDGSILCFGFTSATNGDCVGAIGTNNLFVVKTDSGGNKIWSKCYPICAYTGTPIISASDDGGALLKFGSNCAGGIIPNHYGSNIMYDGIIMRIDSSGNLRWVKVLGGSDNDGIEGDPVFIDSTHFMLDIVGYSNDYDFAGTFGNTDTLKRWIVIMDTTGNIVKQKFERGYTDFYNCGQMNRYGNKIFLTCTGLATSHLDYLYPQHQVEEGAIVIYDTALHLQYMKQWGGVGQDVFFTHCRDADGNFYFAGYTYSANSGDITHSLHGTDDFWVVKTDSNLNKLWVRTFGGGINGYESAGIPPKIFVIGDKMFFWAYTAMATIPPGYDITCAHSSRIFNYFTTDAWVALFDLNTSLGIEVNPNESTNNTSFLLYPNPCKDKLQITWFDKFSMTKDIRLKKIEVLDLLGKIVFAQSPSPITQSYSIDVSNLTAQIYILKCTDSKGFQHNAKFVKE